MTMVLTALLGKIGLLGTLFYGASSATQKVKGFFKYGEVGDYDAITPEIAYGSVDKAKRICQSVEELIDSYSDHTAEILSLFVDKQHSRFSKGLDPGDYVGLSLDEDDNLVVSVDGHCLGRAFCSNTRLPGLLKSNHKVYAYLAGRDIQYRFENVDFCSIIAFYKLEGIPPTVVNIQ